MLEQQQQQQQQQQHPVGRKRKQNTRFRPTGSGRLIVKLGGKVERRHPHEMTPV